MIRPTRARCWACVLACLATLAAPVTAQVYRYKDKDGNWVYTDRQPGHGRKIEPGKGRVAPGAPRMIVVPRSSANGIALVAVNECRCSVEFGVRVGAADSERVGHAVVPPRSEQLLLEVPAPPGAGQIPFDYGYVIGDPD